MQEQELRVARLCASSGVFVFLRGDPSGTLEHKESAALVEAFKREGVLFSAYNVEDSDDVCGAVLKISGENEFPLVFVKGAFVGNGDKFVQDGMLERIPPENRGKKLKDVIHEHCDGLVRSDLVVVFIKGTVERPKCGFTNKMLTLLMSLGVKFSTVNVLDDQNVRDGMKVYANWPSFPQLFVRGKFIGGLDICQGLNENGELLEVFPEEALVKPKKSE